MTPIAPQHIRKLSDFRQSRGFIWVSASKAPLPREPPLAAGYNFNRNWSYRSPSFS
jgi:hypothetical protein